MVHGGNVSNKVRGRRVPPAEAAGRFPAAALADLRPASGLEIALENLLLTPIRSARDTAVSWCAATSRWSNSPLAQGVGRK